MAEATPIGPGTRVTLRFSLSLVSGELIDSTGETAATFDLGDGSLLPGFERAMFGLQAGDTRELAIAAEQGFGELNEANVHLMKRGDFSSEIELTEGLVVSFADQDQQERPGTITRFVADLVEVDFNHPLAGKDLIFAVEIDEVEQISDEILRV